MSAATTNQAQFDRARRSIPGGVNSPVRAYGSVGGTPRFLVSAAGAYVTDVEGREYVDLVASWGPALLGHAHPRVVAAVQDAAARGLSFGASTPGETELAELVRSRVSVAGIAPVERLRLVSTGTEATMTAIRLARGFTGRDLLVKFAGHYHGHSDSLLAEAGSGVATLALPGSAGITAATAAQTIVLPYNDVAAVEAAFAEHGDRIAAVIVEAAAANMGVVAPLPGFNAALSRITRAHGALLILDEVLTGFRAARSGWWGIEAETAAAAAAAASPAVVRTSRRNDDRRNDGSSAQPQSLEGASEAWQPDLFAFGKVIGGGMPLAALGGRAEVMDFLAPLGPVYQAGTLSGNPVAVAAGLATLELADAAVYERVAASADVIADAVSAALSAEGVAHVVQRAGTLFSFVFDETAPRDYAQVKRQQAFRYAPFFHAMLDAGVNLPPSVFEAWFTTAAHDDRAVERVLEALPIAAKAAAAASDPTE